MQKKEETKSESQKNPDKSIISNNEISEIKNDKPSNEIILKNDDENDVNNIQDDKTFINKTKEINNYFNNIFIFLNTNNIDNENIKIDVQNLQKLMVNILEIIKK